TLLMMGACESTLTREFNMAMNARDYTKSQAILENQLQKNPDHAEANYLMGLLMSEQRKYDLAKTHFDRSSKSFTYREHINFLTDRNYNLEYNKGLEYYQR